MKEYLLKLIENDIETTSKYLINWHNMAENFKTSEFQLKRKLAMERKIQKISRYKNRVQNEL